MGSIDELEKACQQHQVRGLKGFGEKTEEKLLSGIALARKASGNTRRRLGDVLPQAEALLEWVKAAPGVVRACLGGSVRRMRETVADVDIIACGEGPGARLRRLRGAARGGDGASARASRSAACA